eukprot:1149772-Rhodomonas_salina.1
MRASISCPGNDFRLGACEAPPAVLSTYLGESLTKVPVPVFESSCRSPRVRSASEHARREDRLRLTSHVGLPLAVLGRLPQRQG